MKISSVPFRSPRGLAGRFVRRRPPAYAAIPPLFADVPANFPLPKLAPPTTFRCSRGYHPSTTYSILVIPCRECDIHVALHQEH